LIISNSGILLNSDINVSKELNIKAFKPVIKVNYDILNPAVFGKSYFTLLIAVIESQIINSPGMYIHNTYNNISLVKFKHNDDELYYLFIYDRNPKQ
jgi:hypothetical protein